MSKKACLIFIVYSSFDITVGIIFKEKNSFFEKEAKLLTVTDIRTYRHILYYCYLHVHFSDLQLRTVDVLQHPAAQYSQTRINPNAKRGRRFKG